MKRFAVLLPVYLTAFFTAAVAGAEPTLLKEADCYLRLQTATMGSPDFAGARDSVLVNLYETQLKKQPDLMKSIVPLGFRDSKNDFLRYAHFWFSNHVQTKQGLKDGESSNLFYFVDQFGVWEGEFPDSYTANTQTLQDLDTSVQFEHPMTRSTISVNYQQGTSAKNASGVQVRFGKFEGKTYPKVKVKLLTGKEAEPYVDSVLAKLIETRVDEGLAGFGHPEQLPAMLRVILACAKIDRPLVKKAAQVAAKKMVDAVRPEQNAKAPTTH